MEDAASNSPFKESRRASKSPFGAEEEEENDVPLAVAAELERLQSEVARLKKALAGCTCAAVHATVAGLKGCDSDNDSSSSSSSSSANGGGGDGNAGGGSKVAPAPPPTKKGTAGRGSRKGSDAAMRRRVLEADFDPLAIDARDTFARALFGERGSRKIWRVWKLAAPLSFTLWIMGAVCGHISFFGGSGYVNVLTLPGLVVPVTLMLFANREITRELCIGTFEAPLLILLNTIIAVGWIIMFDFDVRCMFMLFQWTSINFVILLDAMPRNIRTNRYTSLCCVFAIEGWVMQLVGVYFNLFPDLKYTEWKPLHGLGITVSLPQLLVTGRLFTVLLFFSKNAYFKWKHPQAFVAIKARIIEREYTSAEQFRLKSMSRLQRTQVDINAFDLAASASGGARVDANGRRVSGTMSRPKIFMRRRSMLTSDLF